MLAALLAVPLMAASAHAASVRRCPVAQLDTIVYARVSIDISDATITALYRSAPPFWGTRAKVACRLANIVEMAASAPDGDSRHITVGGVGRYSCTWIKLPAAIERFRCEHDHGLPNIVRFDSYLAA